MTPSLTWKTFSGGCAKTRRCRKPRPVFRVVLDASLEVRSAVVYATFIVALVFLPVLTMTGLQGSFFAPLALELHPGHHGVAGGGADGDAGAVPAVFRQRRAAARRNRGCKAWLKAVYRRRAGLFRALAARDDRWRCSSSASRALADAAGSSGGEFLPEFREGHFVLQVQAVPGTSLPEMLRIGSEISEATAGETRTSPRSSSRSAAPNRARTPGSRTAANFTSN